MSDENQAPVTKILRALRLGLRHFIFRQYTAKFSKGTDLDEMGRVLFRKLNDKETALATLDIQAWLKLMNKNWETVFREKLDYTARGHVNELQKVRNQDSHENDVNPFTDKGAHRIATTAIKLLKAIDKSETAGDTKAKEQIQVIQQIEQELVDLISGEKQKSTKSLRQPITTPQIQELQNYSADVTIQQPILQNQRVIRFAIAIIVIAFVLIVIASPTIDECDPEILGQRYSGVRHALARASCWLSDLANA